MNIRLTMKIALTVLIFTSFFASQVSAVLITEGFTFSVASAGNTSIGDHYHSNTGGSFGNPAGKAEVGRYFNEEVRGLSEYSLVGLTPSTTAFVTFRVDSLTGLFSEYQTPFGINPIKIFAYQGNNLENITDYQAPSVATIGSFSTAGLSVGDILSFSIASIFNDAIALGWNSLGIRLQSDPLLASGAMVYNSFRLTTDDQSTQVPEPGTLLLLGGGLAGLALYRRRMNKA